MKAESLFAHLIVERMNTLLGFCGWIVNGAYNVVYLRIWRLRCYRALHNGFRTSIQKGPQNERLRKTKPTVGQENAITVDEGMDFTKRTL